MAEAVYDPFDEFNRAQAGMGRVRDPYPKYAELRRLGPVHKLALRELLGTTMVAPGMPDHIYSVVTHDAVARVLLDGETFSSSGYGRSMGLVMGRTILEMDEPEHSRYRGLIQKAFTKRALDRWERELVRPVVDGLVDRFAARGHADLVRELTFPFPVTVIAGMIGLDQRDHDDFHRWAVELISIADRSDARDAGLGEAARAVRAGARGAPQRAPRRPDERAGRRRARRRAPRRRGDLRLPAPAGAGRRGDHLPLLEQPAVRAAHAPRAARRAAPRPRADVPGDRGGLALGVPR